MKSYKFDFFHLNISVINKNSFGAAKVHSVFLNSRRFKKNVIVYVSVCLWCKHMAAGLPATFGFSKQTAVLDCKNAIFHFKLCLYLCKKSVSCFLLAETHLLRWLWRICLCFACSKVTSKSTPISNTFHDRTHALANWYIAVYIFWLVK